MMEKHILVISFAYPPLNFIGAFRISKITKNLLEMGYIPHVITAEHGDLEVESEIEIPKNLISYVKWKDPYKLVTFFLSKKNPLFLYLGKVLRVLIPFGTTRLPETRRQFWRKPAYVAALEVIDKYPIQLIYSSSSPPASAIIASRLQKTTGIPWIAEFRDLWTGNPYNPKNRIHHYFEERIEKRILRRASALVTVSKPLAIELEEMHKKPCFVIYNGFDPDDYNLAQNITKTKFAISHTGSIYPEKRDPSALFKAVKMLENENYQYVNLISIEFYGSRLEKTLEPLIKKNGVEKYVNIKGQYSRNEIIKVQMNSTVLLLLTWNDIKAKGTLTGKVFEYIGSRRPILACSYKQGAVDVLINDYKCGFLSNDVKELATYLKEKIDLWLAGDSDLGYDFGGNSAIEYTRKRQTEKLINIFDKFSR